MSDITQILSQIESGNPVAADQLVPLIYTELRQMAARQLATERTGHTLSPTALVHEAYLRLVGPLAASAPSEQTSCPNSSANSKSALPAPSFSSRHHFFNAASRAMRRILVDSARRKFALKRGGQATRLPLDQSQIAAQQPENDLVILDEALNRLQAEHPQLAELVQLRYFGGLSMPQAAEALGIPLRTAERNWTFAKAWLLEAIAAL